MDKLFDDFKDMPLWQEASTLMFDVISATDSNNKLKDHILLDNILKIAVKLPVELAFAGTCPNADIMKSITSTLHMAISLEHHLKILNIEKPAKSLNHFKQHLIDLIEDQINEEFDDNQFDDAFHE